MIYPQFQITVIDVTRYQLFYHDQLLWVTFHLTDLRQGPFRIFFRINL